MKIGQQRIESREVCQPNPHRLGLTKKSSVLRSNTLLVDFAHELRPGKSRLQTFSAVRQEGLLAMLVRLAVEREKNWDRELRRRHREVLRGRKVSESDLLRRAGLA
jgi:hypothetical protein